MEPLSVGASIITVLSAAAATKDGVQRLRAFKHAQAQLDFLNNEITDLELLLAFIKNALERSVTEDPNAIQLASAAIREAEKLIDALKSLIERSLVHRTVANSGQATQKTIRRRGFLKTQRIQDFCVKFKDVRGKLSTALTALTHLQQHSNRRLSLVIEDVTFVSNRVQKDTGDPSNKSDFAPTIPQGFGNLPAIKTDSSATVASSVILSTSSAATRCAQYCPCRCHVRMSGQTPGWLQPFLGVLFFQYSGSPIFDKRPCDFKKCNPSGSFGRFEYRFPTYIMPWILNVTATWDNYGRPGGNWSLRAPNYITGHACGIVGAFEYENAIELEKFMDQHGIPSWAEFTFNGWSLLHLAVAEERWDICEVLMKRGSDLYHYASDGM